MSSTSQSKAQVSGGDAPWSAHSQAYVSTVAQVTKNAARELVDRANSRLPFDTPNASIIELGAGTGSLTLTVAKDYPNTPLVSTDISKDMLAQLRDARKKQLSDLQQSEADDRVSVRTLDIEQPCSDDGEPEASFSHAICSFVIDQIANPQAAVHGMYQLLRPGKGAIAAIAAWDFSRECGPHEMWEEAAVAVDPSFKPIRRNQGSSYSSREDVVEYMQKAGFKNVETEPIKLDFNSAQGVDGFMFYFWDSHAPMPMERMESWEGDLEPVKEAMRKVLQGRMDSGRGLKIDISVTIGTKP